ncbi:hypothetical protein ACFX5K_00270 [Rickettsiales bacterium LUAb2]
MSLYNPHLEMKLNTLEAEFKNNNHEGYMHRKQLIGNINDSFVVHNIDYTTRFAIRFTNKDTWELLTAIKDTYKDKDNKDKKYKFYANDVTRLQYLEYAKVTPNFMGYLPNKVILKNIMNKDTLNILSTATPNNLLEKFNTTIHGKRIKHLFNDFGLKIVNIKVGEKTHLYDSNYNLVLDTALR